MISSFEDDQARKRAANWLGYAGILPQLIAVLLAATGSEYRFLALAGGYAYAAAIFSFLGGVWWGQALANTRATTAAFVLAVLPSLIAVALFLPWTVGQSWPDYSLMTIGILILFSPLVDQYLRFSSKDFLRLRWQLSLSLGVLTFILGVLALKQV